MAAAVGDLSFVTVLGSRVEGVRCRVFRQGPGFILRLSVQESSPPPKTESTERSNGLHKPGHTRKFVCDSS